MSNLPEKSQKVALELYNRQSKAIDIRRKLIELPEIAKALNPVERHIFAASTKTQISEISDADLVSKTSKLFKFLAMDVGFSNTDSETWVYTCTRLVSILQRYYGKMTLADVKLAFELSTVGELDEFLPKDSKGQPDKHHYQQFNAEYFGKILNAYQRRQSGVISKAYKALPEPERVVSEQEKNYYHNNLIKNLMYAFLHYKYLGSFPEGHNSLDEMLYWERLEKVGLADGFVITNEDKTRAFNMIFMSSRLNQFEKISISKRGKDHEKVQSEAKTLARREALKKLFDEILKEEINIFNYLKFKK